MSKQLMSSREAKKVLANLFAKPDAEAIWTSYTERWHNADMEDKTTFGDEFEQFLERCKENEFPISYATGWALSAMACHHHKLCENACNREITEEESAFRTTIESKLSTAFFGSPILTGSQYDPRGRTLLLFLPNGKHNSWDGESWRIPTP
jgi:3-methyladenine DNA glycosylase AlkD